MATKGFSAAAALAFATFVSSPAQAGTYLFDLVPASISGTGNGNSATYTKSVGGSALNLKVTAWSINTNSTPTTTSDDIVTNAILTSWSGGLGVTNRSGESGSPNHAIDNSLGWHDFLLFQFDREVDLNSIYIGWYYNDADATIRYGDVGGAWNATPALHNQPVATLDTLIDGQFNSDRSSSFTGERSVNADNEMANWWIVSSRSPKIYGTDYFKLQSISVDAYPPVPEPSIWMMMIVGFGVVGWSMRRRRSISALQHERAARA